MSLPALDTRVMLRIPDREVVAGRVEEIGHGWIDVELRNAPRTSMSQVDGHWVFLEYVDPAGLVRIMGHVELSPRSGRIGPPTLRFTHREVVQLLRRREFAGGIVHARCTLAPCSGDGVAHLTQTVAIGSGDFAVMELPGAHEGDLYDFTIWPGGNEPPVSGRAVVSRIAGKGHVVLDFVMVAQFERERLGRLLVQGDS